MDGRAFTLAELRTVIPVPLPPKRARRARGTTFYGHLKAAHLAMLKECGLPLDTPMPLVYVRPGAAMTFDELRAEMAKIPGARGGRQLTGDGMREGIAVDVGGGDWQGFDYLVPIDEANAAAARARFHASVVKALRIQREKKGAEFSPVLARYLDARGEA